MTYDNMRRTPEEFWTAYRDRLYPYGTYYVAVYRRGISKHKDPKTTWFVPCGPDYAKAREVFLTTIRDLRKFKRLSQYASVQLLEIRDDCILMFSPIEYASEPVHQWSNSVNTNFSYPTGPTHYLDNRRADERRGGRTRQGRPSPRLDVPLFSPDDYQPVD